MSRSGDVLKALEGFFQTSLDDALAGLGKPAPGEKALALFHEAAERVPAYREFLSAAGIDPGAIRTPGDFSRLPLMTKESYVRRYPLPARCWDGKLEQCEMAAASSGSTGAPLFWPRTAVHEIEIATRFEQIFRDSFDAERRSTLAVVCFTMGAWVGGMFTASCCRLLSQKGYPVTLVTPGANRDEIYRCVTELGPHFDQVVLLGYPPFLKDVIDSGCARGIDWSPYRLKLVMAGEVFSEEWRSLVARRIGDADICRMSASLYGTADAGVLANETPLSVWIRRFLSERPAAARELFRESRLPTLVQYDPRSRYFEQLDGTLLFSGDNGAPLIRYHIADSGGLVGYEQMMTFLQDNSCEMSRVPAHYQLPFVFVFGRSDFTVSYFGANIYPENIAAGLEQDPFPESLSGKFVLETLEDEDRNAHLWVRVELLPGIDAGDVMEGPIAEAILFHLRRLNSEFAHYVPPDRQTPFVRLYPAGDPTYFPAGVKHRYTRRGRADHGDAETRR